MCIDHWRMVPKPLQIEIWRAWRIWGRVVARCRPTPDDVRQLRAAQAPAIVAVREKEIKRQIKKDSAGDSLNFG
jgi:hypothetical protein